MSVWYESLGRWARAYLSTEQNRRDAQSALASVITFFVCLYVIANGMAPAYMLIERPGRAIAVHFKPSVASMADLAKTRMQKGLSGRTTAAPSPRASRQPPPLESLSSMAASRPDYFGRQAILPPARMDLPVSADMPQQWQDRPAPQQRPQDRLFSGVSSTALPDPKIGTPQGRGEPVSEVSFDVTPAGEPGGRGSDFISLSSQDATSSAGRPGGTEMSGRRAIVRRTLPALPDWFERKGLDSLVRMRITVSASGKVESAEVEKTSGFKEIDAEARDAVLQWLFESTGYRETIIVKLNYRLR